MQTTQNKIDNLSAEVFERLGILSPTLRQIELMHALLNHLVELHKVNFDARLSMREKVCLQLLTQGNSLEEIANMMNIKRTTVATFIKRIKKKLQCETLAQAVFKGIKN